MADLPSSEAAAGLDPVVAKEVAADPVMADKLAGSTEEESLRFYQSNILLYGYCRDVAASYNTWITTGSPGVLDELPTPTSSLDPDSGPRSYRSLLRSYYDDAVASGDPDQLRGVLGDELVCADVPVNPDDFGGDRFAVYRQPGEEH